MSTSITVAQVQMALRLESFDSEAARRAMTPQPRPGAFSGRRAVEPKHAAVLLLLFPLADDELALVLLRRASHEHDIHSGQIGLPGGSLEAGESVEQAALREAREEIGLQYPVTLLGQLSSLYIPPSNFEVHPVVGWIDSHPAWTPDPREVAEVIECPVAWLLDVGRKVVEDWNYQGHTVLVPWYNIEGHKGWGATAIILSEFEQRLRLVVG